MIEAIIIGFHGFVDRRGCPRRVGHGKPPWPMDDNLAAIVDLLMGATFADRHIEPEEVATVRTELCAVLGMDELPKAIEHRIEDFEPQEFNVDTVAGALAEGEAHDKRAVLEMIVAINDSDGELAFEEDEYLRRVARGMGVPEAEIGEMLLEIVQLDGGDGD